MEHRFTASTSSSISRFQTTSTATAYGDDRDDSERRAGPLPTKVGELGYVEDVSLGLHRITPLDPAASTETLSGPHPVERERDRQGRTQHHHHHHHHHNSSSSSSVLPPLPSSSTITLPLPLSQAPTNSSASLASSTTSLARFKRRLKFLSPSPNSKKYLLGATPRTLFRFFIQLLILGGTVAGWIFAVRHLKLLPSTNPNGDQNNNSLPASGSIFIHVAFTVAVLIQLLFLERCIFHLRAERFMYLNPNAILPVHPTDRQRNARIAYAPWNRPPLPTYAAAIGYRGTGDVEDNEIARVLAIGSGDIPPQYGNTRGSTLLAYGIGGRVMRSSVGSVISRGSVRQPSRPIGRPRSQSSHSTTPDERPVSYGQSEQLEDAFRAQRLEEALAKLEAGSNGHS